MAVYPHTSGVVGLAAREFNYSARSPTHPARRAPRRSWRERNGGTRIHPKPPSDSQAVQEYRGYPRLGTLGNGGRCARHGVLDNPQGVYVGGWYDDAVRRLHYLRHDGPEHVLAFAPTRSGKGVGLVIPTLMAWSESCVVYDIKGENWAKQRLSIEERSPLLQVLTREAGNGSRFNRWRSASGHGARRVRRAEQRD